MCSMGLNQDSVVCGKPEKAPQGDAEHSAQSGGVSLFVVSEDTLSRGNTLVVATQGC